MNRRSFVSLFGVTAAAIAADPETLWTPGAKLISIPKPRVMGALELYADPAFRAEMLKLLNTQLVFGKNPAFFETDLPVSLPARRGLLAMLPPPRVFRDHARSVYVCEGGAPPRGALTRPVTTENPGLTGFSPRFRTENSWMANSESREITRAVMHSGEGVLGKTFRTV